jgi:hypothetical protein
MVALVSVETVLLVLVIVLVAGLLRSHAELLRRIGPPGDPEVPPTPAGTRELRPPAIAGTTLAGDAVKLDFDGAASAPTLLAFLSSGCSSCAQFWEALGTEALPAGLRKVIVTRGGEREHPAKLRSLAPATVPVLMSSAAWEDYRVPGSPYFLLVDGDIKGEGVASTWEGLSSLVADALADLELGARGLEAGGRAVDATLAAHGIGPGHPSLYPAGHPER